MHDMIHEQQGKKNKLTPLIPGDPKMKQNTARSYRVSPEPPVPVTVVLLKSEVKAKELEWNATSKSQFGFVVPTCKQI